LEAFFYRGAIRRYWMPDQENRKSGQVHPAQECHCQRSYTNTIVADFETYEGTFGNTDPISKSFYEYTPLKPGHLEVLA
jgi:hypothetical protein